MKKLKGFTLLELVIVMAIFSAIAVGAMAMIRPAMQLFQKTSSQEKAAADADNIGRYIQDNLRYADRMVVYQGYGTDNMNSIEEFIDSGREYEVPVASTGTYADYAKVFCSPLQFFAFYYYNETDPDSADYYVGKTCNVMEIKHNGGSDDGKVSIYTYTFQKDQFKPASADNMTSINEEFYNGKNISFSRPVLEMDGMVCKGMKFDLSIPYKGASRGEDGKPVTINQEYRMSTSFLNLSKKTKYLIYEDTFNYEPDTFKYYDRGEEGGNTYIIYTVPEIIIP